MNNFIKKDALITVANFDTFPQFETVIHIKDVVNEQVIVDKMAIFFKVPNQETGKPELQMLPSYLISKTTNSGIVENDKICEFIINLQRFDIIGPVKDSVIIKNFENAFYNTVLKGD